MRIRTPFAGAFAILVLVAAYTGLAALPSIPYSEFHSDKALHFITFAAITVCFYWAIETTRRRILHLTLFVCTVCLAVGSEILQAMLPNGRDFDYLDIAANVVGSGAALVLCAAYHRRMLERKRAARGFHAGGEEAGLAAAGDVELGEGTGPLETGVTDSSAPGLDEELDNWDENAADDWDDQETIDDKNGAAVGESRGKG